MLSGDVAPVAVVVDWSAGELLLTRGAVVPVLCEAAAVAELRETPVLLEPAVVPALAVEALDEAAPTWLGWAPV